MVDVGYVPEEIMSGLFPLPPAFVQIAKVPKPIANPRLNRSRSDLESSATFLSWDEAFEIMLCYNLGDRIKEH